MTEKPSKVLIIGSGPIIIGQAAEFDYAGTQACKAMREEGVTSVLVNSNPATIMTDEGIADIVYIEPLTVDVVARVIYGFRISVLFGLTLTIVSSVVGVIAGAVQGYFGGWVDLTFQRFIEIWTSIPQLYLIIIIAAIITPSFWILLSIMLAFSWVSLVGVVRAEFLRGRNFEYIAAARALGLSNRKIMFKHLLPNAMVATLTFIPFILNSSITALTSLDFLGLGLPPGSPSLGELLAQGKNNLQAPWLGLTAFFVIAIMLSLLIFIGEAIRDAFDPRKTFH